MKAWMGRGGALERGDCRVVVEAIAVSRSLVVVYEPDAPPRPEWLRAGERREILPGLWAEFVRPAAAGRGEPRGRFFWSWDRDGPAVVLSPRAAA